MLRLLAAAAVAVLLAGCTAEECVDYGGCSALQDVKILASGIPPEARVVSVTVCIADEYCLNNPNGHRKRDLDADGKRDYYLDFNKGSDGDLFRETYDNEPVTVRVQTATGATYEGRAGLATYPGNDDSCDGSGSCYELTASVEMMSEA